MAVMLFRPVLSSGLRMALPLGLGLLLVFLGRKHIRPRTLIAIQKLMMLGMLLALVLTLMGPLVRVPVSYQLTKPEMTQPLVIPTEPPVRSETEAAEPAPSGIAADPSAADPASPSFSPWKLAAALWLCGAVGLFLLTLLQNAPFFFRLYRNSAAAPAPLREAALAQGRAIGLRGAPRVRVTPEVSTPMAVGFLRPVVFLPVRALLLPPEQQRLLLAHELYHCKTNDNFWRLFSSALLAVYWFDPLLWALSRSFSTQSELCCDENVLSGASVQTRKLYGNLILSFVTTRPALPLLPLRSEWGGSFQRLKLRIGQIVSLDSKKPGKLLLAACCLIFVLFSGMISRQVFTPSEVVFLPENDYGIAWYGMDTPRKIFPIRPPLETDVVYRDTGYVDNFFPKVDDSLYFIAKTPHQPVTAGCDGLVVLTYEEVDYGLGVFYAPFGLLGTFVIIDCGDGITVRYTYLDEILVEEGQWVKAGDVIGTAGNTHSCLTDDDQCGVYVLQDGVMVDPMLFFDVKISPFGRLTGIPWWGAGTRTIEEDMKLFPEHYEIYEYFSDFDPDE